MINVVRIILLIIAFGVISLTGFYFYKIHDNKVELGNVKIKIMDKGVDVEIENFKVTHEVKGKKEWILKAGLAQVNNQEDVTQLKDVQMILPKEDSPPYVITAESGTYQNSSKDVHLVGRVKLTGDAQSLSGRFQANKNEPPLSKTHK
jgi:LPS export ABC transporter protein LptC